MKTNKKKGEFNFYLLENEFYLRYYEEKCYNFIYKSILIYV